MELHHPAINVKVVAVIYGQALSDLDADLAAHGVTWFKRNLLDLTAKSAREFIRGRSGKRAPVDYDRLCAYPIFAGLEVTGNPEETGA